jgi:hypothetical protein
MSEGFFFGFFACPAASGPNNRSAIREREKTAANRDDREVELEDELEADIEAGDIEVTFLRIELKRLKRDEKLILNLEAGDIEVTILRINLKGLKREENLILNTFYAS